MIKGLRKKLNEKTRDWGNKLYPELGDFLTAEISPSTIKNTGLVLLLSTILSATGCKQTPEQNSIPNGFIMPKYSDKNMVKTPYGFLVPECSDVELKTIAGIYSGSIMVYKTESLYDTGGIGYSDFSFNSSIALHMPYCGSNASKKYFFIVGSFNPKYRSESLLKALQDADTDKDKKLTSREIRELLYKVIEQHSK